MSEAPTEKRVIIEKDQKPGMQTSEFWLSVVAVGAGLILIALGQAEFGQWLIVSAVGGYSISRGIAKR